MRKLIFTYVMLTFMFSAYAGGFQVGLQGQRQTGMGLTGTGFLSGLVLYFLTLAGCLF